jgi:hypothetical protein
MMKAEYNRQGAERKDLVQAISTITEEKAKYLFLPTKAYRIGSIMVWKNGTVECENPELFQKVVKELESKGFRPEETTTEQAELEGTKEPETTQETVEPEEATVTGVAQEAEPKETVESEEAQEPGAYETSPAQEEKPEEVDTLTISLPDDLTDEDFAKLQNLVASKASLFKKALGTNDLTIQRADGKISFPWFHGADSARAQAYAKLVTALCQLAKKSKRITAKEHEVPNEKYAFRCFLLRLGFIGREYKDCRKILLEKLSGSAAFRNGGKKDAVSQ